MLYFNSLPQVITPDENGNPLILTNLLTRARLMDELQNNPMLFYKYTVQDSDTPEIIADKYYDDPNRFWLVLYANEIMDPLWSWPLPQQKFLDFIDSKYKEVAEIENKTPFEYTNTTIQSYQKIVETTDSETSTTTVKNVPISLTEYNSLVPSTNAYNLPNGYTCTINISKKAVTIYEYEYELNDSKRYIKLINATYASRMEQVFKEVMSA